ncbi:iron-sulfur cluster biosynthesis family protein [Saliterribacillus persicus]|uniref:Uncharacterized protein YqkB n=1 Tax=Saliterribacillus persicus TaxID=930114 RepID=A0A368XAG7_9BACI|nr:iron-sulfur cluster biosynthesis family protein [Saliterribacillus persicus]RCW64845.1 uncharacterized protein YqkB [Saliterribacillus persicus]
MQLLITHDALEKINTISPTSSPELWLYYDTEGCGCGVNGVPTVKFFDQKKRDYELVYNKDLNVFVHAQQAVFFGEEIILDFRNNFFQLKNKEEMLNPRISETQLLQAVN